MKGNRIFGNIEFGEICSICPANRRHRHYSSGRAKMYCLNETHFCPPCGRTHLLSYSDKLNIVLLGTSTLFVNFDKWSKLNMQCIDYELIAGGHIRDLRKAYSTYYTKLNLPTIFIVCGGLNDINEMSMYKFLDELFELKNLIEKHPLHTAKIAGLLCPPKLCLKKEDILIPNSETYKKIMKINKEIYEAFGEFFTLEFYGLRERKNNYSGTIYRSYKTSDWREMSVARTRGKIFRHRLSECMHLTDTAMIMALKRLIELVEKMYA